MILETKAGSESLKRSAKYGNSFPLKKRCIKYAVEDESEHLDNCAPENLSTKPQDLCIRSHIQGDPPKTAPPQNSAIVQHHRIPPLMQYDYVAQYLPVNYLPQPAISSTHQLENDKFFTKAWPNNNFHLLNSAHFGLQVNQHQQIRTHSKFSPSGPLETQTQVTEVKGHFGGHLNTIRERENSSARISSSNCVLNYGICKSNNNSFEIEQRDSLSRSSCDSGVSFFSGSSTQSTTSSVDADSCASDTPKTVLNSAARYHCPTCNKEYSTMSGLTKHVQFHCGAGFKKSFACKDCQKAYTSLGALKMHIRTHTLPCKCDTCGKAFSRPWLLQGHKRTHSGEKPYACSHCLRAFADRSNLRAHLQTHTKSKKYACPTCAKTFSRMSLLTKHAGSWLPCSAFENVKQITM